MILLYVLNSYPKLSVLSKLILSRGLSLATGSFFLKNMDVKSLMNVPQKSNKGFKSL